MKVISNKYDILLVTDTSPKKYRFSLVSRLQNLSLDVLENLYRANGIKTGRNRNAAMTRLNFQRDAKISLDLLCYIALIARTQNCILPKQYEQIAIKASEIRKLIYGWAKADIKRMNNSERDGLS